MRSIRVPGISGSLRKGSHNTGLLRAVSEFLPEEMTLETFDLSRIPIYNDGSFTGWKVNLVQIPLRLSVEHR